MTPLETRGLLMGIRHNDYAVLLYPVRFKQGAMEELTSPSEVGLDKALESP